MINIERTIISQYGQSSTIGQLIAGMNAYIDPSADLDNFYNFVWNVDTARGFGLNIWGRIVGVKRELTIPLDQPYFGFNEATPDSYPFDSYPMNDGSMPATQTYALEDDAYRQLILVKALSNISSANCPSINQLLQNLFAGRGRCYVNDLGGMQIRYTFEFLLTPYEFAIMTQSGALPRPAGVSATLINTELPYFGFNEAGPDSSAPFDTVPFIAEGATNATI